MDSKKQQKEEKRKFYYSIIPDELLSDETIPLKAKLLWAVEYRYCKNKTSKHPSTTCSMDFFAEQMFDVNSNGEKVPTRKRSVQRWKALLIREGWQSERKRPNKTWVTILNKEKEKPLDEETDRGRHDTGITSTSVDLDELIPR